jgi:hypothetical protein
MVFAYHRFRLPQSAAKRFFGKPSAMHSRAVGPNVRAMPGASALGHARTVAGKPERTVLSEPFSSELHVPAKIGPAKSERRMFQLSAAGIGTLALSCPRISRHLLKRPKNIRNSPVRRGEKPHPPTHNHSFKATPAFSNLRGIGNHRAEGISQIVGHRRSRTVAEKQRSAIPLAGSRSPSASKKAADVPRPMLPIYSGRPFAGIGTSNALNAASSSTDMCRTIRGTPQPDPGPTPLRGKEINHPSGRLRPRSD